MQGLEDLRRLTEELRKKETELRTSIASVESVCARLSEDIRRKESAVEGLEQRLKSMQEQHDGFFVQLQEAGLKSDSQSVEEILAYLTSLDSQIAQIRGEQESVRKELQTAQMRVSNLGAESRCPLCLQGLSEGL